MWLRSPEPSLRLRGAALVMAIVLVAGGLGGAWVLAVILVRLLACAMGVPLGWRQM